REDISRGLAAGKTIRSIAAELGRSPSTVSREIAKNKGPTRYRAVDAHDRATRNRSRPQRLKLQKNPVLTNYVSAQLQRFWAPEQIAGQRRLYYPNNTRMNISHESIYRAVYLHKVRRILPHNINRNPPIRHAHTTRLVASGNPRSKTPARFTTALPKPKIGPCWATGRAICLSVTRTRNLLLW